MDIKVRKPNIFSKIYLLAKEAFSNTKMLLFLDQGFVSISNFMIGILLARLLGIEEFGFYSMLWIIILFFSNIQFSLIISPMMSIGIKYDKDKTNEYYTSVFIQQIILCFVTVLIILGLGNFINYIKQDDPLGRGLLVLLSLICFSYQTQDFLRRYFFCVQKHYISLVMDVVNYIGQFLTFFILYTTKNVSLNFFLWGVFCSHIVAIIIGVCSFVKFKFHLIVFRDSINRNYNFSKWMLISNTFQYVGTQGILWTAGFVLSPVSLGGIRATFNLTAPISLFMQVIQNYLPIKASLKLVNHGEKGVIKYLLKISLIAIGLFLIFVIFSIFYGEKFIDLIYGDKYGEYSFLLPFTLVYIAISSVIVIISTYFRAIEKTKPLASSSVVATIISIIITIILMPLFKEIGVMSSLVFYNVTVLVILLKTVNLNKHFKLGHTMRNLIRKVPK
ncbi:hypothetical protein COK19_04055 [Bacillus cereus]|uniref:lipopolysaccharide biosynthesis protein n=1 Tax=Bacillus cereus TaxID=1396 RepID=UPI000BF61CED|nr:oligosaccharide flippase family protein [Bacillus cereus]PFR30842.1 hypothetical protein COK19_04055 [Bacillus cereus]